MCLPVKPYKVEREWEHAGLKCAVVMNRENGNRCGYVRVPLGHADYGKQYDDVGVDVHGGLTFDALEPCAHEDGQGHWFGFDCAHSGDALYAPDSPEALEMRIKYPGMSVLDGHYWTQAEVEAETERLAEQLATRTAA